jgi:hypothetical protein
MPAFLNNTLHGLLGSFFSKKKSGETIVEILVSLFVLTSTGTATAYVINQTNQTSYDIQQNFQARYLAEEAFDYLVMIRDTNWIRFSDRKCWDVRLDEKECAEVPSVILPLDATKDFSLVTAKAQNLSFRLVPVASQSGKNLFDVCMEFDPLNKTPYTMYRESSSDAENNPYEGLLYSTDGTPPADATPMYCRKITLAKVDEDTLKVDATIGWKVGSKLHTFIRTSYLNNF